MLLGSLLSLILISTNAIDNKPLNIGSDIFFYLILPIIIFSGGYNLKKKRFFKNFSYIFLFGFFGTLINFIVMAWLNYYALSEINTNLIEMLVFCATMCATDSVASLTIINKDEYPKLFSIIFGEGMVNDGVSIILFTSTSAYYFENKCK